MSIIIFSAIKRKAVVNEDTETYIYKMQQQINEEDNELAKGSKKTQVQKIHQKLVAQLKKMWLTEFNNWRPFLVTAPVLANIYMFQRSRCIIFPGMAIENQVDDPSYNIVDKNFETNQ